jgi:hypothetical protein
MFVIGATGLFASGFTGGASLGAAAALAGPGCAEGAAASLLYYFIARNGPIYDQEKDSYDVLRESFSN